MTIERNGRDIGPPSCVDDIDVRGGSSRVYVTSAEWEVITRTMRRSDLVRRFLAPGPRFLLGFCWREPAVIAAVLRVFWQRRRMRRALSRRGFPAWVTES